VPDVAQRGELKEILLREFAPVRHHCRGARGMREYRERPDFPGYAAEHGQND
jgi:hypothetical protein